MKSISSALSVALGAPVQRPAVLVEMGFSPIKRLSSGPTVASWGGYAWPASDIGIEGLRVDALRVAGTLVVGNMDGVFGALCISEGVQDKSIRIWGFDAAATTALDVVWLCDAQASATSISKRDVRLALRHRTELIVSPRTLVNAAAGFTQKLPAGTVLRINGIDYRLERAN